MLSFQPKLIRLFHAQPVRRPRFLKQFEAKVATQRFLDHHAVILSLAHSATFYHSHDLGVKRQGRSDFRHLCIMASSRFDAPIPAVWACLDDEHQLAADPPQPLAVSGPSIDLAG